MPTPAALAIFSREVSTPLVRNASDATSRSRSRLRHASTRCARCAPCAPIRPVRPSARSRKPAKTLDETEGASVIVPEAASAYCISVRPPPHDCKGNHLMTATTRTAPAGSAPAVSDSGEGGRDRRSLALAVIGVAQLMIILDASIVNIALPHAQQALHIDDAQRQWVLT